MLHQTGHQSHGAPRTLTSLRVCGGCCLTQTGICPGDMAFISGDHKILYGSQNGRGIWFGPVRPPTCTPKHADPMESDPTLRSESSTQLLRRLGAGVSERHEGPPGLLLRRGLPLRHHEGTCTAVLLMSTHAP